MYSDSVPIENRLLCGTSSPGKSVWLTCHSLHAEERRRPAANWLQEVSSLPYMNGPSSDPTVSGLVYT